MLKKGDTFSASFTIDNKIYTGFIDIFDDTNFLHTNSSYAQKAGFKDKVMHGAILNGFLSHFIGMSLPVKNIFLHSVQIDYKKPMYLNDSIHLFAEVQEIHESVNVFNFKITFTNSERINIASGKFQIGVLKLTSP